ncbi:hypothetical protein TL16_g12473 [Triparma laevis f. inornata]|uniref:Uncharacterized protein n=2 Tax=Triparma laevis TaxID=1534972 RepID=A0A9W7FLM5_9STRA|nr:hypothetical protein TL16_g12473 [Triparma laevis f. inornata]GMI14889.1 hypothetical protein TrLO_g7343 [Triparma laevis f. longispina]
MGAVIRRFYTCIVPLDPNDELPVCTKSELTDFEKACLRGLQRTSFMIAAMFLVNVGMATYVYEMGDETLNNFLVGLVTFVTMLPQFVLSNRIALTEMGRKPVTLGWFRLTLIFFMLMNLIRLYVNNATLTLQCGLVESAFEPDNSKPSSTACSTSILAISQAAILIYVIFTLFQLSIIMKLENTYKRRALKAWAVRFSEGSVARLTQMEEGSGDNNNI